ncbi:hypothetical protein BD626DRAFT_133240 [Schizophyllum amplum]|uniref:Uncharacterized protein n=1 Tax=Schizophyllum amplum TaxID=97359 RepID=A0A550C6P7_9AGAR|nr:hypothetical protein BD626DRAFT_133240 [Auriculariopsis ampla]
MRALRIFRRTHPTFLIVVHLPPHVYCSRARHAKPPSASIATDPRPHPTRLVSRATGLHYRVASWHARASFRIAYPTLRA